jgi:hypothetical protein
MLLIVFIKGIASDVSQVLLPGKLTFSQEISQFLSFGLFGMEHLHHLGQFKIGLCFLWRAINHSR